MTEQMEQRYVDAVKKQYPGWKVEIISKKGDTIQFEITCSLSPVRYVDYVYAPEPPRKRNCKRKPAKKVKTLSPAVVEKAMRCYAKRKQLIALGKILNEATDDLYAPPIDSSPIPEYILRQINERFPREDELEKFYTQYQGLAKGLTSWRASK